METLLQPWTHGANGGNRNSLSQLSFLLNMSLHFHPQVVTLHTHVPSRIHLPLNGFLWNRALSMEDVSFKFYLKWTVYVYTEICYEQSLAWWQFFFFFFQDKSLQSTKINFISKRVISSFSERSGRVGDSSLFSIAPCSFFMHLEETKPQLFIFRKRCNSSDISVYKNHTTFSFK